MTTRDQRDEEMIFAPVRIMTAMAGLHRQLCLLTDRVARLERAPDESDENTLLHWRPPVDDLRAFETQLH